MGIATGWDAMTNATLDQSQTALMPKEDLTPYEGQWVALRAGHVVASDVSAIALRDQPAVEPSDMIMRVPNNTQVAFIL
jgi:hypothetical protein